MTSLSTPVKNFVFCPPLLGKPDPTQPKPSEGLDTRNRVIQLGSKDNTCWYAVFNLLRERYKAPNTKNLPERKFEQLVSSLRKSLSAYDRSLPDAANQLNNDIIKKYFKELNKQKIENPKIQEMIKFLDQRSASEVPVCSIFPGFLKQEKQKNLYDYLLYLKFYGTQNICNEFFNKLKINPKHLFEIAKKQDPVIFQAYCQGNDWEGFDWQQKSRFLDLFAKQLAAKHYSLQISSWHPSQSFGHLITELQKRGPLVVGGCFGALHYGVPAKNLGKKIEGRAVYGWTKTDPKNKDPVTGHAILLVGAEKTSTQELVYYIDPVDDSDPLRPEKQRIFCMSYQRLTSTETICDYLGFIRNNAPSTIGYAVYREKPSKTEDEKSPS